MIPGTLRATVHQIGQVSVRPCIVMKVFSGQTLLSTRTRCLSQQPDFFANFSARVVGSYSYAAPVFPWGHIVVPSGCLNTKSCLPSQKDFVYFADASPANSPVAGKLGDIQASTATAFNTPSVSAFKYSPAIIATKNPFTFTKSGILETGLTAVPIPFNSGQGTFSFDKATKTLVSSNYNIGALVVEVSTTQPFQYTLDLVAVCPNITSMVITGCYDCPSHASAKVNAYSTCGEGSVSVGMDCGPGTQQLTDAIILQNNAFDSFISFIPPSEKGSCNLTLTWSHLDTTFNATIATAYSILTQDIINEQNALALAANTSGVKDKGWDFGDIGDKAKNLGEIKDIFSWDNLFPGGVIVSLIVYLVMGAFMVGLLTIIYDAMSKKSKTS